MTDLNALDDEDFRLAVRRWLREAYPPELRNPPKRLHWRDNKVWYLKLAEKGWLAPGWPREHGGMGLSAAKQLIMLDEYERHGVARTNDHGIVMLGPLLIRYGTEAQKSRFLPKILSGEHIWCQGYSEPNAGSDLASVATTAVREGEDWVLNGQKTWTTLANDANWIFVLARTDRAAKKQEGISFFLVPMDAPGVTVRPIVNLDLHDEFCEVFFDTVRVPHDNLVGAVNQGWTMAKALLGFERVMIGSPKQSAYALGRLRLLAQRMGGWDDPVFQDRYTGLRLDLADHTSLYETYLEILRRGEMPGADASMLKLHQSELYQRITDTMLEIAAENAGLLEPMEGNRDLNPAGLFLQARPVTIYGGSNEIQRNILARTVLGLPG
ncbi:acyl-CoA dehydrogenase family protein [Acidiphilium sp. AL]|uniref:Acyl-CoA dehydrogenase family protein n=1 Tax=Acidiphilium iwatense TaxID=768198 RepID=A0ABS9DRN8_9PROT|nr:MULTISPECIES: acyl-CoA dehydrogenase family protein [Acidiphilium]MCF3945409.1 acyl-CoA dehydrogenase family protein [Acidiphilium iwatense]MCU4158925.1 acyl-CoA dehydrogenase family protein [Acidiphilium sp. AL]